MFNTGNRVTVAYLDNAPGTIVTKLPCGSDGIPQYWVKFDNPEYGKRGPFWEVEMESTDILPPHKTLVASDDVVTKYLNRQIVLEKESIDDTNRSIQQAHKTIVEAEKELDVLYEKAKLSTHAIDLLHKMLRDLE